MITGNIYNIISIIKKVIFWKIEYLKKIILIF